MNSSKRPNKIRKLFVVAFALAFSASWSVGVLFAAAPTVTTGAASSITKTTATIDYTISDDGGKGITSKGFEYGTTTSYGSTSTATAFFYGNDQFFGQGGAYVGEEGQQSDSIGITRDTLGNVYVAEFGGNRIQKFNSSGVFQSMFGWGVDTGANAFEICTSGCEIALPGTGNGQFNLPSDIAIDSSGNIYVVESGGSRIQKFNSSFAYQSQFGASGTSEGQFTIENGIAIDASDNIYVVDAGNSRIQKFNSSGVFQSMFGWGVDTGANAFEICTSGCQAGISGGGNGQFNFLNTDNGLSNASDIAFDSSGNIYVVDSGNNRIQKFDSMGNYVSQYGTYGTGQDEFVALRSISIDQNDDIYAVYGTDFDRVKKIDTNYNFYSSYIIGGPFNLYSSFVDLQGKLFLGGTSVVILYLNQYYGTVGLSGLTCGTTYHYRAFATNADGTSYGGDATFDTLACDVPVIVTKSATDIRNTAVVLNGLQTSDGVSASTARGFQYGTTTSYGNTTNSTSPGTSLSLGSSGFLGTDENSFDTLAGVGQDDSGNIYVADTGNNRIVQLDSDGIFIAMFGWGVATGGNTFESCSSGCQAGISGSGNGQFNAPQDVAVDMGTGNIYVSDTGNNRIQIFNSSHVYQSQFGSLGAGAGQFSSPKGIAIYSSSIYLADSGNNRVQKLNTSGTMLAQSTGLSSPSGVVVSDDGYVYVTDTGNDRILSLSTSFSSSADVSFASPPGWIAMDSPTGIAIDTDFGIYITDSVNDRVIYASRGSDVDEYTFVSSYGSNGSGPGQFDTPKDILLDTNTFKLYSADSANSRLQIFRPFFYKELKPLTCGTTYHYRVFATNSDGTAYGDDVTFNTLSCGSLGGGGGGPIDPSIYGCTDSTADNYDSSATDDDGSCYFLGCIDNTASNYDSTATVDDNSCVYGPPPILGCMDTTALNYNSLATVDDGSCDFGGGPTGPTDVLGCTDTFANNYDSNANVDDGSCTYTLSSIAGCTDPNALNYNLNANVGDGTCAYEPPPPPPWLPPPVVEVINEINEAVRDVTGWTPVQQANTYQDVAVAGLLVPSIMVILAQRSAVASVALRLWNIIPTLLGFRRKRRPWGTVYDSVTKQPLDPVYVTLQDLRGNEVGTSITDLDGRYGFVTERGEYRIDAKKSDYVFPSVKMRGSDHDDLYGNLYFGEDIRVENEGTIINKNIPMDAINFNWNEFEKAGNKRLMKFFSKGELFLARIAKIIFIAGFLASFFLIFIEPTTINYIILCIYAVISLLAAFGVRPKRPGFIIERSTGYPLSFAILTVYSALLKREVAHTIVGKTGKYHVLVPKGKYYISVKKKTGEDSYEDIYTSEEFKARKGYINRILKI